ncbi:MAG: response regulator transcription factor [Clostridia bacterium]|nr:response regulator transcription factor [Clostridia bacterium]
MRIAICDDEARETENLARMIEQYAFDRDVELTCDRYTDGRALLGQDKYDLYFLDYRMDGMDGIEVAKALKERFSHAVTICYLTNYDAAAAEIINQGIHADGFLKKPLDARQLADKLDQFYRLSFFHRFELKKGKRFQTVYTQDILYAEADDKQVILHMWSGNETFHYLLRDLEALLPQGLFFRVQRSYLVNLQYVDSYDAKSVRLVNGDELPLKAKDFQQAYHRYMFLLNR